MCEHFQASPKKRHISAVKRIMKYLSDTHQMGLWYLKETDCDLVGYSNSEFVRCILDRKSNSGICHLFRNSLVSWHRKKQASVALSTIEA